MRILYLVHRVPYPPNKGDKIRALWEIRTLAEKHEIDLFCFYDHEEDKNSIDALRSCCRNCYAERLSWWGGRLRALIAAVRRRSFSLAYFYSATMAEKIRESLAARDYDVAVVFGSAMAQYLEAERGLPRILDMVDVDSDKWAAYAANASPFLRWLWKQEARLLGEYEVQASREFSQTLLCTDAEAEILKRRAAGAPIDVLRHMIDTGYFDPQKIEIPADVAAWQPYVIFTGSMDYAPNVEAVNWFCREIFPAVRKNIPELKFVIAGRNPARAVLALANDPAVKVTGSVPDVRPYLRGAAVAVAPMLTARGVQNKILESMAMGLPVISSSKAAVAFPEEVRKLVVVEDDPSAVAARLVSIIHSGPQPPLDEIRSSLVTAYGDTSLSKTLEQMLEQAVADMERSRRGPQ